MRWIPAFAFGCIIATGCGKNEAQPPPTLSPADVQAATVELHDGMDAVVKLGETFVAEGVVRLDPAVDGLELPIFVKLHEQVDGREVIIAERLAKAERTGDGEYAYRAEIKAPDSVGKGPFRLTTIMAKEKIAETPVRVEP